MQESIVNLLRCPLSGEPLTLEVIQKFKHPLTQVAEIYSGVLWCNNGGCYPVINGIPRMLPDSFLRYSASLVEWWPAFEFHKNQIISQYGEAMKASSIQSKKIKSTFGFEWGLLKKSDRIKIWNLDTLQFKEQLLQELQLPNAYTCENALDAGCGHGRSARLMAGFCANVFGVEVSPAVELAYNQNSQANCHFIQADIHRLPFAQQLFDLVYSSGVLHHNISTQKALNNITVLVKAGGILSIWLYHPFKNVLHNSMCVLRNITSRLPVRLIYYINSVSITPLQWLFSQAMGQKKKFTEISIEQLDMLTPRYRHEHTPEEVTAWLKAAGFNGMHVTDKDNYGFSMKAIKNYLIQIG